MKKYTFSIVLFVMLVSFSFLVWKNKLMHLEEVSVNIKANQEIFKDLKKKSLSQVQKFKGDFLFGLNVNKIDEELKKDLRIKKVGIYRSLPNRIDIELIPHKPIALLLGKSQRFPLVRDGSLLPKMSINDKLDLPLVRGKNFHKNEELRKELVKLLMLVPEKGILSEVNISEVSYHKKRGFVLQLISPSLKVRLGEAPFDSKINRVERVLNYMKTQELQGRVIDARLGKKVVVKMRNEL